MMNFKSETFGFYATFWKNIYSLYNFIHFTFKRTYIK